MKWGWWYPLSRWVVTWYKWTWFVKWGIFQCLLCIIIMVIMVGPSWDKDSCFWREGRFPLTTLSKNSFWPCNLEIRSHPAWLLRNTWVVRTAPECEHTLFFCSGCLEFTLICNFIIGNIYFPIKKTRLCLLEKFWKVLKSRRNKNETILLPFFLTEAKSVSILLYSPSVFFSPRYLWYLLEQFLFFSALVRYNWSTKSCTYFKCTIWWI